MTPDPRPPVRHFVRVRIENTYSDGHESTTEVDLPPPGDESLDDWFNEVVHPHTGDGHGLDRDLGSHYQATIIAASGMAALGLVGAGYEWMD